MIKAGLALTAPLAVKKMPCQRCVLFAADHPVTLFLTPARFLTHTLSPNLTLSPHEILRALNHILSS
jgi:hypothetical protein